MSLALNLAPSFKARPSALTFKKVGGLTFIRLGRWQVSLCKVRAKPDMIPAARVALAIGGR